MLIKEVEELTGIKSVNIRHYEKENLIHPLRKANGYREYSEEDVRRLKQIKTLRLLDVSVSDIQKILNDQITLKAAMEKRLNELNKEEMKIKEIRATCELIISENVSITNLDENILHGDKNTWKERLEQIMKEDIDRRFLSKAILYITGWAVLARILYIGILAFKTTDITLQNLLTLRPSGIEFYLSLGIGIFFLLYGIGLFCLRRPYRERFSVGMGKRLGRWRVRRSCKFLCFLWNRNCYRWKFDRNLCWIIGHRMLDFNSNPWLHHDSAKRC